MGNIIERMANAFERFFTPVRRFFFIISGIILVIMPLPVFIEVVGRKTFIGGSIPGIIEIEEYFMLFLVFFALATTHMEDAQIRIDLLYAKFPKWIQNILGSATSLLSSLIFILICTELINMGIADLHSHELSWGLNLPLWIFRFAAALGALLMIGATLLEFMRYLKSSIEDRRLPWLILSLSAACLLFVIPITGLLPTDMSMTAIGIAGMGLMFLLIFLGMPIGIVMGMVGFLGMIVVYQGVSPAMANLGVGTYRFASDYIMTVMPLFLLIGQFAYQSGISKDIFNTASTWMGRIRGGVAMSSVAGCAGFAAVAGDSLSTAVTMGTLAAPEMRKRGYSMRLGAACLAAGGTLGILIPPSIGFILYALVTETSIGKLFISGVVPGVLLTSLFMLTIYITARINPKAAPAGEPTTLKAKLVSLKGIIAILALFILVLGGIMVGIFSPVEGGSIGAIGTFLYAFSTRRLTWKMFIEAVEYCLKINASIMMIIMGVGILGYFLAATRLPFVLAEFVTGLDVNRYLVFTAIIILFIFLGCIMNVIAILLIIIPTIFPSIIALGFDPIWFGVICVISMEMGQITPPIGINVFAISGVIKDVPMQDIFKGVIPFFICMVLCIVLLTLFPQIALFLPGLFFK